MVEQAGERIKAALSECNPVLPDCGKRRRRVGSHGQIVEAHDTDIVGDADVPVVKLRDGGDGAHVMGKEDGSNALLQQSGDIFAGGFRYIITKSDIVLIDFKPVFFEGVDIGVVACL